MVGLSAAYAGTAPAAAARDGDLVHLWIGGAAAARGEGDRLYDPALHRALLAEAFPGGPPAALWSPRNDALGAFFYPPPAALGYAPLGSLPMRVAARVHPYLHLGAGLGAAAALARLSGLGGWAAAAVVLTAPATFHGHVLGQNGVYTLLLLGLAGLLAARGRAGAGGGLTGLLIAKPSWLLALLPAPLALGGWAAAAGAVGGAAAAAGASLLLPGPGAWAAFFERLPGLLRLSALPDYPLHLQYGLPAVGQRLGLGAGAGVGVGLLVWVLTVRRARRADPALAFALAVAAAGLTSPHVHPYDLIAGLPGLCLLLARAPRLGLGALLVHHLGQAAEGLDGSGLALPPATIGALLTWAALLRAPRAPGPPPG